MLLIDMPCLTHQISDRLSHTQIPAKLRLLRKPLLLNPLNEKIKAFQEQVAQTYDRESKERLTLKNEIERLALLNARISEDAVNLTQALKGSNRRWLVKHQ